MSPIVLRKRLWLVPPFLFLTLSMTGLSVTFKVGPYSWNSRSRSHRVDLPGPLSWRSRRGAGFPWLLALLPVGSLSGLVAWVLSGHPGWGGL